MVPIRIEGGDMSMRRRFVTFHLPLLPADPILKAPPSRFESVADGDHDIFMRPSFRGLAGDCDIATARDRNRQLDLINIAGSMAMLRLTDNHIDRHYPVMEPIKLVHFLLNFRLNFFRVFNMAERQSDWCLHLRPHAHIS